MKQLDSSLLKIAQTKSCNKEEIEIFGEKYVSKASNKQNKIAHAQKTLLKISLGIVATIVMGGAVKLTGDISFADDVRKEVNAKEIFVDNIGGMKEELVLIHDKDFVTYINQMSDLELSSLYNETSKQMKEEGLDAEATNMTKVVTEMEGNYLEELKSNITK